nr:AAA family ATPase [uncultured Desulfobulbus sp.]
MKLKRLDLKAFGPFTDRILEFNSNGPGLHVIFGPNEAGKSSSLRGLKALLYGFHAQTPDNFLHSYEQLLVGGLLENSNGQELIFQRRKKRINDLIDENGAPLETNILAAFLHGVEAEIFESLYGIDHDRLVQGGREILAQQGEVGKSLFAAGTGISSLREVIEELEQESAQLFKARGSNPEINQAIKRYKELQKEIKQAILAPKEWKELKKSLEEAESERSFLEQERSTKNRELRSLERLKQAIPELASLKVWRDRMAELGDVVLLPPDIQEKQKQVEQATYNAESQLMQSRERLKLTQGKLEAISINTALLEQSDLVDDFFQRLGEYRKGQKDSPQLNGMRINLRRQAASLLKQVRQDMDLKDVEILGPVLSKKKTIQSLSAQFEAISQNVTQSKKRNRAAYSDLEEVNKELSATSAIQETDELTLAVKLTHKVGDIDAKLSQDAGDIEQGRQDCRSTLKRLGLWSGALSELLELSLPLVQTIQQFEKKFREIEEKNRVLTKERKNAASLLNSAETELKKIQYIGEVPSEHDLRNTREKRNTGWQLLRKQWLGNEDITDESTVFDPERSLHDAYEGLVTQADTIADRLRTEADRVANTANFKAQIEQQQRVLAECATIENNLIQREKTLVQEWSNTWKPLGISPLSPNEMGGWLTSIEQLRYRIESLAIKEKEASSDRKQQAELKENLTNILTKMGFTELPLSEKLGPILIFAETIIEKNSERQNKQSLLLERQKKAQKSVTETTKEYKEAQDAFVTWKEQWANALSGLGLKGEITSPEALDYIETLQDCLNKEKEAGDLKKRIDGIERDADRLEAEVNTILQSSAPSLRALPLDQAILHLRVLLKQAQNDKSLFEQLTVETESLQAEISIAEKNLQDANKQMEELLDSAHCKIPEELGLVISTFLEYQKLREKISSSEEILARIGEGTKIDALAAQAALLDPDELPSKIESVQQDIEERIHPAITEISQKIGEIKNKLAAMDGSSKAADASDKMEQELAKIRRLVERYTRVKLASKVLQQEIEHYREQHQDPVLKLASKYFAELTLNSFSGLRADVSDKGEPVLEGIRPDGKWTNVSGMSDGTRDQLYLSLRLATLEWRMETSEPMPFIVDDILINFDDDRSRATLKALAHFSKKNQVILFTHHRQLVDDAERVGKTEEVVVHML